MRDLVWDGYLNARDLGGLPTPLSATGATRFGRVARGPRRELLTEAGWRDARGWGLAAVVDLRCADEIGVRDGDPVVSLETREAVPVVSAPTEDQDDPEFRETCFPILDSPEYWRHNWRILPHLVLATLTAIADAPHGLLVHCSAGRDRTGMVSALLLSNAGVSPAVVAADYAESVRAMAGAKTHAPNDRQATWGTDEVDEWIAATALIVEDVAADVDAAFATIGADADLRSRLRARLTER
ncbi:tyrosine-protein phosphatase [Curtobacterium sp. VKM Ac-2865]|uniref:tyrosine-protein phosphatase n=1 Tax=Curtobacterium sp. VKM Ac-2865 TaxID=2783817 RepID=UPI00188A8C82|nr:tyrosine-protein phosphatase [Curtobacterium sp. VKM Ac-2865]MBF4583203.1 tyrosine-protein phosphatase [Curtobacterium sp. VKM Ac-2865]